MNESHSCCTIAAVHGFPCPGKLPELTAAEAERDRLQERLDQLTSYGVPDVNALLHERVTFREREEQLHAEAARAREEARLMAERLQEELQLRRGLEAIIARLEGVTGPAARAAAELQRAVATADALIGSWS